MLGFTENPAYWFKVQRCCKDPCQNAWGKP
uniref:Uncharacterized protein n=1 Tax=Arundo donax TaxID=35708 RepID=A0A0A9FVV3_ARUDO